jgi:hypothetical protein
MTATYCSLVFLSHSLLGCGFGHGHGASVPIVPAVPVVREVVVAPASATCCDVCGVETAEVRYEVGRLLGSPRWRQRDNGAHELREFDWRCHPEILPALTHALLTDCEEEVREEAAETLAKIDPPPCVPEVHAALARAAQCDPDHATRKDARRALDRIGRQCAAPCDVCGPGVEVVAPGAPAYVAAPPVDGVPMTGAPGVVAPPGAVAPTPYLDSEPALDLPPGVPAPGLAPPELPSPAIPPLPGEVVPFELTPEARRALDARITARQAEARDAPIEKVAARADEDATAERPARVRRGPLGFLRRGR